MMSKCKDKRGFTLIELVLVVAIFALVSGSVGLALSSFIGKNQLESSVQRVEQSLRRAQFRATTRIMDDQWGVVFDDSGAEHSFTFFKGSSFGVDGSYDDQQMLPKNVSFSTVSLNGGSDEVVFEKVTGETDDYGEVVLEEVGGDFYTVTINALGQVEVN